MPFARRKMITAWEWIVIVFIIIAIFLWGPQKLPQLARALGQARREFERASREPLEPAADEDILIRMAKELGISTEGKTREEISREIIERGRAGPRG